MTSLKIMGLCLRTLVDFCVVALLWGCTNPFLKRGSEGIQLVSPVDGKVAGVFLQLKWLALNLKFVVPFLINQAGSVLYFITVGQSDISLAVPIINSLTLAITVFVGILLGEQVQSIRSYCGMILIITGVCLSLSTR